MALLSGSMLVRFGPLYALQRSHASASAGLIRATMLARHEVFNMKGNERGRILRYAAILAGISGAPANQFLEGRLHLCGMLREKEAGFGVNDGDQVNGFHEFLVLGIFGGRERPLVDLAAQFRDSSFRLRVRAQSEDPNSYFR